MHAAPPRAADAPWVSLPVIAALASLAWGLLAGNPFPDGDPYWHLAVGRWIAAHHAIPQTAIFSHSIPHAPWTAHEWLSELLMHGAFSLGGWEAILVVASVAFAITSFVIMRCLVARMEPIHAIMLGVLCIALVDSHFMARPHVFVWPLTAIWIATLIDAAERDAAPPFLLLPVLVLWANMHGSFSIGVAMAGAICADAAVTTGTVAAGWRIVKRWLPFLAASVVCGALTPRGLKTYAFASDLMSQQFTLNAVGEWRSANFHDFQVFLIWILGLLLLGLLGVLRLSPIRALIIVGLALIALKYQRYHSTAGLISPFILALPVGVAARRLSAPGGDVEVLDRILARLARPARGAGMGLAAVAACGIVLACARLSPKAPAAGITPRAALAAFRATGAQGNVFNMYVYGGYLIFEGVPVYLDGRGDMYGDAFLNETHDAMLLSKPQALERALAKYRIGWTLLDPTMPANQMLDVLPAWERIYADSVAVVHVRRDLLAQARAARAGGPAR